MLVNQDTKATSTTQTQPLTPHRRRVQIRTQPLPPTGGGYKLVRYTHSETVVAGEMETLQEATDPAMDGIKPVIRVKALFGRNDK